MKENIRLQIPFFIAARIALNTAIRMVYPYLRAIVSDVCTRAGFPPVTLSEVNFQAMFEAQQQQLAALGNGATSVN